jgi:threonine dehydrogenase-like Zn-dependent dehydrogenase
VRGGHIDPRLWVTHRLSLDELPDRFEAMRADPGLIKAIVTL